MVSIPFGRIVRELREEHNLSKAQLAKMIGVSNGMISYYEVGDRYPSLSSLIRLSKVFGVTTDYLLGLESEKREWVDVSGLTAEEKQSINLIVENYRNKK